VWTASTTAPRDTGGGDTDALNDVIYGTDFFVTVGEDGSAHKSLADASVWGADTSPGIDTHPLTGIAYDGNHTVIVGTYGESYWSNDALNWSLDTFTEADHLQDVVYANNQFSAVSNAGRVFHSATGALWDAGFGPGFPNEFYNIAYGSGRYVTVGSLNGDTVAYWSSDGTTWNASQTVSGVWNLFGIAYLP